MKKPHSLSMRSKDVRWLKFKSWEKKNLLWLISLTKRSENTTHKKGEAQSWRENLISTGRDKEPLEMVDMRMNWRPELSTLRMCWNKLNQMRVSKEIFKIFRLFLLKVKRSDKKLCVYWEWKKPKVVYSNKVGYSDDAEKKRLREEVLALQRKVEQLESERGRGGKTSY